MDWFYLVLSGVVTGPEARSRINAKWDKFVVDGLGCKCVSDEPWVTVAESCELTMALIASGNHKKALQLFNWLHDYRDDDELLAIETPPVTWRETRPLTMRPPCQGDGDDEDA